MLSTVKPPPKALTAPTRNRVTNGHARQQPMIAPETIDWDSIVIEDDTPVENYTTEQHYPLLTTTLYDSWSHSLVGKRFIAVADVGVFSAPSLPAIVPDVFLSLGVLRPDDRSHKRNRSYFIWEVGKQPEVVIEIVSNDKGDELDGKLQRYAEIGVLYYAVFDPLLILSDASLRLFRLMDGRYVETAERWMPEVELGFTLWQGDFQGNFGEWLRWCSQDGTLIPTGGERAAQAAARAEYEAMRADYEAIRSEQESARATQAAARAERLAAQLRRLGLSEDDLDNG